MSTPDDPDHHHPDPAALDPSDDPADNPHDAFVKRVLTSPESAGVELRFMLPALLVERLDWATLRVVPISFVDANLAKHESDILYAVDLADTGRTVFVYVLLEHQSTIDRMMAWRFLKYLTCIWERWEKDQPGTITALPLIVPLLMFQGPAGWTAPRRLSALFDLPPELATLATFPVDLVFDIDDLREAVLADRLARDAVVAFVEATRAVLLATRSPVPLDPALQARLLALGSHIALIERDLGLSAVHTLIRYVTSALPPGSPVRDTILGVISEEKRMMYLNVYDEMRAEGQAKGQAEGQAKGRADGKAATLLKLLTHRGLVLDETLRARVATCTDEAQLDRWFDRALTAATIAAIFAEP